MLFVGTVSKVSSACFRIWQNLQVVDLLTKPEPRWVSWYWAFYNGLSSCEVMGMKCTFCTLIIVQARSFWPRCTQTQTSKIAGDIQRFMRRHLPQTWNQLRICPRDTVWYVFLGVFPMKINRWMNRWWSNIDGFKETEWFQELLEFFFLYRVMALKKKNSAVNA